MKAVFKVRTLTHGTWEITQRLLSASEAMDFVKECEVEPLGELITGECRSFGFSNFDGHHQVTYLGETIKDTSEHKPCSKCGQQSFKLEGADEWECDNCIENFWIKNMRGRA